jgi:hypothetical protein
MPAAGLVLGLSVVESVLVIESPRRDLRCELTLARRGCRLACLHSQGDCGAIDE